jgi:hypothetical protein
MVKLILYLYVFLHTVGIPPGSTRPNGDSNIKFIFRHLSIDSISIYVYIYLYMYKYIYLCMYIYIKQVSLPVPPALTGTQMLNTLVAESLCSITSIVASNYPAQFIGFDV